MDRTLKTLTPLITPEYNNMTLEQLASIYETEGLSPSVLAAAFSKVYNLINNLSSEYFALSSQDVASYSLEILDYCLREYEPGKAKFSTYFTVILKSRLREETKSLFTYKRRANLFGDSLEYSMENGFDIAAPDISSLIEDEVFMEALKKYDLTERELRYCYLVVDGYKSGEIASLLKVSAMTLTNIRKSLRVKISPLFSL